jgi:DnaJ-class molecular chaperone
MKLKPGEYAFKCIDCDGAESVQMFDMEGGQLVWEACPDCRGAGEVLLDEDEALEYIENGFSPLRTP